MDLEVVLGEWEEKSTRMSSICGGGNGRTLAYEMEMLAIIINVGFLNLL